MKINCRLLFLNFIFYLIWGIPSYECQNDNDSNEKNMIMFWHGFVKERYISTRKRLHIWNFSFFSFEYESKEKKKFQQNSRGDDFRYRVFWQVCYSTKFFFFLSTHLFQMHDFSPFPAPIPKVGRRPQTFGKCGIIPVLLVKITAVSLYGTQLLGWRLPWVSV